MIDVMERTESGETVVNGLSENVEVNKIAKTVNILGTEYKVIEQTESDNKKLENANGLCEMHSKKIIIDTMESAQDDVMTVEKIEDFKKKVLRHEIIHAFLYESGLWENTNAREAWATNEEMTDWIAIQSPKIFKAFQEVGCL